MRKRMSREEMHAEYALYLEWGRDNPHVVQSSVQRSGRNWLGKLMLYGYNAYSLGAHGTRLPFIKDCSYVMNHVAEFLDLHEDTKYIVLIRDPRDVMLSWCRVDIPRSGRDISLMETASDFWTEEILIAKLGSWMFFPRYLLEPNCLIIQYERMCLNPITELTRVEQFLGIDPITDLDAVVKRLDFANFRTGLDRYHMQCLKYQRDSFFPSTWNRIILDYTDHVMREWGYFPGGQGASILAAL